MARQLQAALLCAVTAVLFVALDIVFDIQTGMAGVFVMGVAGGLLIGNQMTKEHHPSLPTSSSGSRS